MTRRRSTVSSVRRDLYRAASLLGWVQAAQTGRLPQRVIRVAAWRAVGQIMRAVLPR